MAKQPVETWVRRIMLDATHEVETHVTLQRNRHGAVLVPRDDLDRLLFEAGYQREDSDGG